MALIEREAAIKLLQETALEFEKIDECSALAYRTAANILTVPPTIDPIRAAGGCRCGECAYYCADAGKCAVYGARRTDDFCSVGEIDEESEPREAQDDG